MSSDFYFRRWRTLLKQLETLLETDIQYQTERSHDQHLSDAVHRMTLVLGQYMVVYDEAVECLQNNLQVQKAEYMENIVTALVARILEMKRELQKLECSDYQFFGRGLILKGRTTDDAELTVIPKKPKRTPAIQEAIENTFVKVKKIKEDLAKQEEEKERKLEEEKTEKKILFEIVSSTDSDLSDDYEEEKKDVIPPEVLLRLKYIAMIKAHEKLRQTTRAILHSKLRRETWEKELRGTLQPPARYELREKSALLLKRVFRAYFEIKRKRIETNKRDEILGLNYCKPLNPALDEQDEQRLMKRTKLHDDYEKEWLTKRQKIKSDYEQKKGLEIAEDFRDLIRGWFREWFDSIKFIHDIPNNGGVVILREEAPDPLEWGKQYEALMKKREENEGKSPQDLKYEAHERKLLQQDARKEEKRQKKAAEILLMKMMKHPTMHPGYHYPPSKKTDHLVQFVKDYHVAWDSYDMKPMPNVKQKYIQQLTVEDAYKDAKIEILNQVTEDMDQEHQQLKQALRMDYKNNEAVMPEQSTKRKKPKKIKPVSSALVTDKIEALAMDGWIITDYPKTKLKDYSGDPNFVGEDMRRLILPAFPHSYEVRGLWWEKCYAVGHGSHKILLVAPHGSGKMTLVHALATLNDAVLFELDPTNVRAEFLTPEYMKTLSKHMLSCARAVQPSVIHIKHVQKLFYAKEPPEEAELQLQMINKFFLQHLLKKIHKHDKITVVGSCSDPWLTNAKQFVKKFPIVILLPNTTYSNVVQMLKRWVMKYHSIPCDFDISSLARVLQGYTFGCLETLLDKFMTEERIIRTATSGISPMDVYNFILEDETAVKVEYDLYLKWYWEKTPAGRKEKQHMDDMLEYKEACAAYEAKEKKKARIAKRAAARKMI